MPHWRSSRRWRLKSERRRDLLRILRKGHASSQGDIVRALIAAGHDVTQATVSRDLRDVGATKVLIGDRFVYRLKDEIPRSPGADVVARNIDRTLAEFALDVRQASSLVVVVTAPGHAAAVARAIDFADLEEVVGTVAGDDTVFVATPDPTAASALTSRWLVGSRLMSGEEAG
jgi:transcriptional regulator of arginine metabolism